MSDLGGASFKVIADASAFIKSMDDAEKKALSSSKVIETAIKGAEDTYKFSAVGYGVSATRIERAFDKQVAAAVEATNAQKLMRDMLAETNVVQTTAVGKMGATATASMGMARGFLQASYAIDDIQYGFRAIVNNIPQVAMGIGAAMGKSVETTMAWAGAAGIAAVAVSQLINHWGELASIAQSAWEGGSAERLAKLAERAEEASKAFDKLANSASRAQNAEASGVADVITEKGAENLAGNLAQRIGMDPGLRAEMSRAQSQKFRLAADEEHMGNKAGADKMRGEIQEELDQENLKKARELIGAASIAGPKGDQARLQLRRLDPDIARDIELASPAGQERVAQKNLDLAGGRQGRKQEEKALDDAKKFGKAEADEWRKGVEEAQKHLDAKNKAGRINALEDQRTAILEKHHQEDLTLEAMRERFSQGSQTLQGPKSIVDFYQKASNDNPLVRLAQETKRIQEDQRTELKQINQQLEKERRVRPT